MIASATAIAHTSSFATENDFEQSDGDTFSTPKKNQLVVAQNTDTPDFQLTLFNQTQSVREEIDLIEGQKLGNIVTLYQEHSIKVRDERREGTQKILAKLSETKGRFVDLIEKTVEENKGVVEKSLASKNLVTKNVDETLVAIDKIVGEKLEERKTYIVDTIKETASGIVELSQLEANKIDPSKNKEIISKMFDKEDSDVVGELNGK